MYYWLKHEKDQSSHIFDMEKSHSFQLLRFKERFAEYNNQIETTYLKKSNYDCHQDDSMFFKDCINEFITDKMGCMLPWIKQNPEALPTCQTKTELQSFRDLYAKITSQAIRDEIERKGCFVQNCKRTIWIKNQYSERWLKASKQTKLWMYIPSTAKVLQRREILLANTSTFMADIGSYLGLFLGASILSLSDFMIDLAKLIQEKLSRKKL